MKRMHKNYDMKIYLHSGIWLTQICLFFGVVLSFEYVRLLNLRLCVCLSISFLCLSISFRLGTKVKEDFTTSQHFM